MNARTVLLQHLAEARGALNALDPVIKRGADSSVVSDDLVLADLATRTDAHVQHLGLRLQAVEECVAPLFAAVEHLLRE